MITYRTLLEALQCLTDDMLDMTVSVFDESVCEIIPIKELKLASEINEEFQSAIDGVVEDDQPLIIIGDIEDE